MEIKKNPGPDWEIDFRWLDDEEDLDAVETLSVFGMPTIETALDEAHLSLSDSGTLYEIIAVRRIA